MGGMKETCESGVLAGYPLIDVKVTLVDGSFHDVDSSEMAFKIAGSMAFKDGVKKCNPVLLEPMMKVEVESPDDFLGSVIGDLSSSRDVRLCNSAPINDSRSGYFFNGVCQL